MYKLVSANKYGRNKTRLVTWFQNSYQSIPKWKNHRRWWVMQLVRSYSENTVKCHSNIPPIIRMRIVDALDKKAQHSEIMQFRGWIRTFREQKTQTFIELNDGSSVDSLQIVLPTEEAKKLSLSTGAAISAIGCLEPSPFDVNKLELVQADIEVIGPCGADYPLQKKRHSFEYLREVAHLRPRTNTFGAVMRVRNAATMSMHEFFQRNHFINIHTPIINASDCEGAGELFFVNTKEDIDELLKKKLDQSTHHGVVGLKSHFFGVDECNLTVSGQLEAEIFATAMSKVYSFGPTFRAENSHTTRHLSEFWMVEPEMAFADLQDVMDTAEACVKSSVDYVIKSSLNDLTFFCKRVDNNLMERLIKNQNEFYARMSYTEAVKILQDRSDLDIVWGQDLGREHEKWLCEDYANKPVFVSHYPKSLKPFYMRVTDNTDTNRQTVDCCDLLIPRVGELIGGSVREERLDILENRMNTLNMEDKMNWYLDLRKYGSVPHGGFGLGFERLLLYLTGLENIRDVIPVPRHRNYCKF